MKSISQCVETSSKAQEADHRVIHQSQQLHLEQIEMLSLENHLYSGYLFHHPLLPDHVFLAIDVAFLQIWHHHQHQQITAHQKL